MKNNYTSSSSGKIGRLMWSTGPNEGRVAKPGSLNVVKVAVRPSCLQRGEVMGTLCREN